VIPDGTRSALYFGSNGTGAACYGGGVSDPALHNVKDASGQNQCYDPVDSNKGTHSYPYRYQVWAYDLNDFAAVKAGKLNPWDVRPYAVWELKLPTPAAHMILGGATWDAATRTLYVSQRDGNKGNFSASPVLHAFTLSGSAPTPTPVPVPVPTPVPPPPVSPVPDQRDAEIAKLQAQLLATSAALDIAIGERDQALAEKGKLTTQIETMNAIAKTAYDRAMRLKSKPAKWIRDALEKLSR
jgi:hypothetical protein